MTDMTDASVGIDYFESVYATGEDPWSFSTSAFEREKYGRTVAAIADRRYRNALEIGCSIGVLTAQIAEHVDELLAIDFSETALARARARNAELANVRFERVHVPREFPAERFDLIVVSEVAYFWSDDDFAAARELIAERLEAGGDLVLVHCLEKPPEHLRGGDEVNDAFASDPRYQALRGERTDVYRLDVLRKRADTAYFEMVYGLKDDPYVSETSEYEREKYDRVLATLAGAHFHNAYEIGCSIGALSVGLAAHADRLLAVDISESAIVRARERHADLANVTFERANVPAEFPTERFDLIVVCDVAYYWPDAEFARARDLIAAALVPGGTLLIEHFLPQPVEHLRGGDAVHEAFLSEKRYRHVHGERFELYRLDVLRRR